MQEKGRAFGIYAIAVTRLADNEVWHIYRRYSDFHDLHCSIKDKVGHSFNTFIGNNTGVPWCVRSKDGPLILSWM